MGTVTQILHISLASAALALLLGAVRGLPRPPTVEAAAASCGGPEAPGEPGSRVGWISAEEARTLLGAGQVAFVDCRSEDEFSTGHVSGALHLPAEAPELATGMLQRLRAVATVVTYCDAVSECQRSQRLATLLSDQGLPDVRVLQGGLPAWLSHGYPAESGICASCTSTN